MWNAKVLWILLVSVLVAIGVGTRLIDHPANFVPMGALAIVSGYYLRHRYSWLIPLISMLLSDLYLGFYDLPVMASVYASYGIAWFLAYYAANIKQKSLLIPLTFVSSLIFFLTTNFSVWLFTPMYSKTFSGLLQSYAMGLPFFKWTLTSDLLFTALFVGIIELSVYAASRSKQSQFSLK